MSQMIPPTFNYQGKIYENIGMIKLVQDSFLFAKNGLELTYAKSKSGKDITIVEKMVVDKVLNCLKKKKADSAKLTEMVNSINTYLSKDPKFLRAVGELNSKPTFVSNNIDSIDLYVERILSGLDFYNDKKVKKEDLPPYDENTVTATLNSAGNNFDVGIFVTKYLNDFNEEQINVILTKFADKLDSTQISLLNERKKEFEKKAVVEQNVETVKKPKKLTHQNKKAAFADTLLLTFIVGTLCGVYLMYFILTIID